MSRLARSGACIAALLVIGLIATSSVRAATVDITPIGTPAWDVVDPHLVAIHCGIAASGYAEFFTLTGDQILPPPNHKNYPNVGVGPGAAHGPPYDTELGAGLAALSLTDRSSFAAADFSNGRAVMLACMIVGNGTSTGSSPEFTSGPIIPNSLFPLTFAFRDVKDGVDFSEPGSFPVPSHTTLDPAFANLDGTSHLPFFLFDNADFAKTPGGSLAGSYAYDVTITDTAGEGYTIHAPFTVTGTTAIPLPSAVWPGLALLAGLPAVRKLRRR